VKNRACPENFHCTEYTFCIQDFWSTCACPEKQSCPENFQAGGMPRLVRLCLWHCTSRCICAKWMFMCEWYVHE